MTQPREREEPLFLPDPEPEPVVLFIRAVCGFLVGLFIAGATSLKLGGLGLTGSVLLFTVVPVGLAYLAARWGDELWRGVRDDL